jgi:hypothetical protein
LVSTLTPNTLHHPREMYLLESGRQVQLKVMSGRRT